MGAVETGPRHDVLSPNPRAGGDAVRWIVLDTLCQRIKAHCPAVDEGTIIVPCRDDDVQKSEGECRIRTRTRPEPQIGPLGLLGTARINSSGPWNVPAA